VYEFVTSLAQPFPLLHLLAGAAVVNLWRKRRESRGRLLFLTLAFAGLTFVSTPAGAYLAVGTLEWPYPPADGRPATAEAVVVLAAGLLPADDTRARAELDADSRARCLHAARLYRQGPPCPVLVSGGKVDPVAPGPTHARAMADFLIELGVRERDLVLEESSRTTYENAVGCARLMRARGIREAVLVVDAVDMFRALRCFRRQGLELTPSPCHYRAGRFGPSYTAFVPSLSAVRRSERAWHEWLGCAWYWLHGRI
jgi:uncharacterized SAM-binding protein YcdF (DUF218 family)